MFLIMKLSNFSLPYDVRMDLITRQLFTEKSVSDAAKKEKRAMRDNHFMHADIAPYDELLDSSKQFDIGIVANLLDVIKK